MVPMYPMHHYSFKRYFKKKVLEILDHPVFSECQTLVSPRQEVTAAIEDSTELGAKPMTCPPTTFLTSFDLDKYTAAGSSHHTAYVYQCCSLPNGRTCSTNTPVSNGLTAYNTTVAGNADKLENQIVDCGVGKVLDGLQLEVDSGTSTWG
jgi:hypothetical protein